MVHIGPDYDHTPDLKQIEYSVALLYIAFNPGDTTLVTGITCFASLSSNLLHLDWRLS